jgi:hypothetical protein
VSMPCSPPDEKDVALGKSMPLYSRNVQTYCSLAHAIKRNQCLLHRDSNQSLLAALSAPCQLGGYA